MQDDEARTLLGDLSAAAPPYEWPIASEVIGRRGEGGSDPWDLIADSILYVTKFAINPQDAPSLPRRKVVTSDLIAGRIAGLFEPRVAPDVTVLDVPTSLIESEAIIVGTAPASTGPAFGSRVVRDFTSTTLGSVLSLVPAWRVAQILVFQALVQGSDHEALVSADGRLALSVDHGHCFGGGGWGSHLGSDAESPRINPFGGLDETGLRAEGVWATALSQLSAITDERLVHAFVSVPESWGCDGEFLAPLVAVTARRRDRLPEAVDAYLRSQ